MAMARRAAPHDPDLLRAALARSHWPHALHSPSFRWQCTEILRVLLLRNCSVGWSNDAQKPEFVCAKNTAGLGLCCLCH
jgi:hypothetical protein